MSLGFGVIPELSDSHRFRLPNSRFLYAMENFEFDVIPICNLVALHCQAEVFFILIQEVLKFVWVPVIQKTHDSIF